VTAATATFLASGTPLFDSYRVMERSFDAAADSPARLIAAADAALYRAESAGRDCVIAAQDRPGGATDPPRLVPSSA
jgi:hypothetical protein